MRLRRFMCGCAAALRAILRIWKEKKIGPLAWAGVSLMVAWLREAVFDAFGMYWGRFYRLE